MEEWPLEERPIRPAGEAVLRAFAGEDVGRDHRAGDIDSDDEDDEYTRQDFENALLGVAPPEPGIDGGASADFAANEGLNEMNVEQLMSRAAARDSAAADGLAVDVIGRLICADYAGPEGKECSVCISLLDTGQQCIVLPCGHMFHQECILRWFERQSRCPYCREQVT